MKIILHVCFVISVFVDNSCIAQQVLKTVLAEHFTNTYCKVCAARNPGLYSNIANYPEVLYISYHPSAPYAACPLNKYNTLENDARTKYYDAYGGTPNLFVGGKLVVSPFTDNSIFTSQAGEMTSFDVRVSMEQLGSDSAVISVVVKKVDTSTLSDLELYGAIAEDTLFFTSNNGEALHINVFRRSLWGTDALSITAPAGVGDSVIYTQVVAVDPVWVKSRVYAIAMLQQADKQVVQAAVSAKSFAAAVSPVVTCPVGTVCIYPNPAEQMLFLAGNIVGSTANIYDETGRLCKSVAITRSEQFIDVSSLRIGLYYFVLNNSSGVVCKKFLKQ